jgi:pyruvate dehydrogenase E1 component alpha subunit
VQQENYGLSKPQLISMYERMLLIRGFEDRVFDLFAKRMISGTAHLCQGQEAVSVGVNSNLRKSDWITCTYRGHGHCLAKGMDPKVMMAEIFGKATGCSKGKGGTMHLTDHSLGIIGEFAIVGAQIPVAVGAALSSWYRKTDQVAVAFFGEGAANIGAFHEGVNMAAIMKLPVVFVCENNLYGEFTAMARSTPVPNIADRASSYGIPGVVVDGNDLLKVYAAAKSVIEDARAGKGPTILECKTYRHKGHSKTDPGKYRPNEEVAAWMAKDPLILFSNYLQSNGLLTPQEDSELRSKQLAVVETAYQFAVDSPYPNETELTSDVYV